MPRTPEQIEALKQEIAAIPSWYHVIDLGDGVKTPGAFELSRTLREFPLPEDMTGMRVIDVGCSNGYYSYEFEKRGAAEVVGVDLPSWLAHDWSPRKRRQYDKYTDDQVKEFDDGMMRASFELVGRELGSKVVRKAEMPIYEVSPKTVGMFDLVFCGAMIMHVRDPILGIHALRSVCKPDGMLVISISTIRADDPAPIAQFAGTWDESNFWQMNPACLRKVLECCDFEPTGDEALYQEPVHDGSWTDTMFACRARPRAAD